MPRMVIVLLASCVLIGWALFPRGAQAAGLTPREPELAEYEARADAALEALMSLYWNPALRMFNNAYPCENCNEPFHYWWQAHGIDVLLDAYERTGDDVYLQRVSDMYDGLRWRNGGHLFNDFYDDEQWMALALLRAYTLSNDERYLHAAQRLWDDIRNGWNDALAVESRGARARGTTKTLRPTALRRSWRRGFTALRAMRRILSGPSASTDG